ncbi:hypothetical protein [Sorangium sp. So ce542]|uniref:hypothetical protein n=1 Tax=Sorangium sp. So ce542 TaxID=3133316 RepID=UPI003F610227
MRGRACRRAAGARESACFHGDRLYLSNKWGGVVALDVGDPSQPRVLTEYWTALPARRMFVVDRFLTTYTVSSFPYPAPAAQQAQVIQLCP